MPSSVMINLLDGPFVGCIKDWQTTRLEAIVMPDPTGFTYSWSKVSGVGDGSFDPSSAIYNPSFMGVTPGHLTIKVVATNGIDSCEDSTNLTVLAVDDLTESIPLQEMDEYDVLGNFHQIPYSDPSDGDLKSVLISPIADPDQPYRWIDASDIGEFGATTDHGNGDVIVELRRTGVYLVKTIRQNGTKFFELNLMGANLARGNKLKKGKAVKIPKPSADLIMIGSFPGDQGLANNRNAIGAGNYVDIGSVADVIDAINTHYANNGQQPFSIAILEHGYDADQSMGGGVVTIPGKYIKYNDPASAADTAAFTSACNEKITSCFLGGCCVARGANGQAFLQKLADDGNMTVSAFDESHGCDGAIFYKYVGTTLITKSPSP